MIPSVILTEAAGVKVYQRGLVIDSQLMVLGPMMPSSVSKGIGD